MKYTDLKEIVVDATTRKITLQYLVSENWDKMDALGEAEDFFQSN